MAQNEYTTNRKYRHLTREKRAKSGLQGQLYIMNLPEVLYSS